MTTGAGAGLRRCILHWNMIVSEVCTHHCVMFTQREKIVNARMTVNRDAEFIDWERRGC